MTKQGFDPERLVHAKQLLEQAGANQEQAKQLANHFDPTELINMLEAGYSVDELLKERTKERAAVAAIRASRRSTKVIPGHVIDTAYARMVVGGTIVLLIAAIVGSFAAPLGGVHEMIRGIIITLHSDQPINSLFTSLVTPWSIMTLLIQIGIIRIQFTRRRQHDHWYWFLGAISVLMVCLGWAFQMVLWYGVVGGLLGTLIGAVLANYLPTRYLLNG